jgi:hypothetical protein
MPCPFCPWSDKTNRLPKHLMDKHPDHIHVNPFNLEHYITATADAGSASVELCYCLTCKQGTPNTSFEGHGARWVSIHEKKAECRKAHPAAFAALKKRIAETKTATPAAPPTPTPTPTPTTLTTLWDECKANHKMRPIMKEIESDISCDAEYDDDDPMPFTAEEGFKRTICKAVGYQKQVTMTKEEMAKLVLAHDAELTEHRQEIITLRKENANFKICYNELYDSNMTLSESHRTLTDSHRNLKESHEALKAENQTLKESYAILSAESNKQKDRILSLEDRIRQLEARLGMA